MGVLTSNYEYQRAPAGEENVYRLLHLEGDLNFYHPFDFLLNWNRRQAENKQYFMQVFETFSPDVILVWSLWALSKNLAALAEKVMPEKVVYYLAGHWPVKASMHREYWEAPARHMLLRPIKRVLARLMVRSVRESEAALEMTHALCVSAGMKRSLVEGGLPIEDARIVHNGIVPGEFSTANPRTGFTRGPLKLLYAGQLAYHKGVHTALLALTELVQNPGFQAIHLTILGAGHPDYMAYLRRLVAKHDLHTKVTFLDPVPRSAMPHVFSQCDVLLFPSSYAEPLARVVMEAMAAGLVVIGTTTGGTGELLVEGETGLTFSPEDAKALSVQIVRLANDRGLGDRLIEAGRRAIEQRFTLSRMVEQLEAYLMEVTEKGAPA